MKFFAISALFVAAALADTPDLSTLPQCALACFASAVAASGCQNTDYVCQCTTGKQAVTNAVTPCIMKQCDTDDQAKTVTAAAAICNAALSGSSSASGATATGATGSSNATKTGSSSAAAKVTTNAAVANNLEWIGAGAGVVAALLL